MIKSIAQPQMNKLSSSGVSLMTTAKRGFSIGGGGGSAPSSSASLVMPIPRVKNLSLDEFQSSYFAQSQPVLITDAMNDWKGLRKWKGS